MRRHRGDDGDSNGDDDDDDDGPSKTGPGLKGETSQG